MSRRLRPLLLLAIAIAAVGVFWQFRIIAPIRAPYLLPQNYDDFVYYQPTFTYAFDELRAGRFPFWNPHQHAGTPFLATAQHLLLYPLNILFLVLPTPAAMAGTTVLHLLLALVFTFALARSIGLARAAAATAAVAFGFSTAITVLVYLPHHLYGAVWIPLLLALVHRVVRGPRRVAAATGLGTAAAAQYLGGYPMFCLFSAYGCAAWALWLLVGRRRAGRPVAAPLAALAASAVLAVALAAPLLLPAAELAARSPRAFATLHIQDADPMYKSFAPVSVLSQTVFPGRDVQIFRPLPHVGIAALALACLAPWHRARRADAGFFALLAAGSLLLGLGRHTPLFALYFHLPTADWFRLPNRFYVLTALGLAMLAGIGADRLLGWAHGRGRQVLAVALPLAVYASLYGTLINRVALPETHPTLHAMPAAVVDFLRAEQDHARTYVSPPGLGGAVRAPKVPSKSGMQYGLYVATDRENVYSARFAAYVARLEIEHMKWVRALRKELFDDLTDVPQGEYLLDRGSANWRLLDLLGVRYLVGVYNIDELRGDGASALRRVFGAGSIDVYENPTALPRVFVVDRVETLPADAVLDRLVEPSFDPLRSVVLEERPAAPPTAAPGGPGRARIVSYGAEEVVVEASAAAPALLVLTDQDYPGWEAEVDGAPTPIYTANYLFRAVSIPGGTHRVVFRFQPRSFQLGLAGAALGLATFGLIGLALARRERRGDDG